MTIKAPNRCAVCLPSACLPPSLDCGWAMNILRDLGVRSGECCVAYMYAGQSGAFHTPNLPTATPSLAMKAKAMTFRVVPPSGFSDRSILPKMGERESEGGLEGGSALRRDLERTLSFYWVSQSSCHKKNCGCQEAKTSFLRHTIPSVPQI